MSPGIYRDRGALGRYTSRNSNDFCNDHGQPAPSRIDLDFKFGLRQRALSHPVPRSKNGPPNLSPRRVINLKSSRDWFYNDPLYKDVGYGNFGEVCHLVIAPVRFLPSSAVKWEIDLRKGKSARKKSVWISCHNSARRSFSVPPTEDERKTSNESLDGISFQKHRGSASQWEHLIKPGKLMPTLDWETTLRGSSSARVDGALVELIGRKALHFKEPKDSIVDSDPKLRYLYSSG